MSVLCKTAPEGWPCCPARGAEVVSTAEGTSLGCWVSLGQSTEGCSGPGGGGGEGAQGLFHTGAWVCPFVSRMCREAPLLSLCSEPWRLRLLTPSSPSAPLSSCTGRAVCPRCSTAWTERVRSPGLVRSLPQGLGLPESGVTVVVSPRGSSSVLRVSTAAVRTSGPCAEPYGVAYREFVCQPAIGRGQPAEPRPKSRPHHPWPALPLSAGSAGLLSPEAPGLSLTWKVTAV